MKGVKQIVASLRPNSNYYFGQSESEMSGSDPSDPSIISSPSPQQSHTHLKTLDVEDFADRFSSEVDKLPRGADGKTKQTKRIVSISVDHPEGYQVVTLNEVLDAAKSLDVEGLGDGKIDGQSILWFDFTTPTKHDMHFIEQSFKLHPLTTEDILIASREKIEIFDKYIVMVIKEVHFSTTTNSIVVSTLTAVVAENVILTFHPSDFTSIGRAIHVVYIASQEAKSMAQSQRHLRAQRAHAHHSVKVLGTPTWVLHALIDTVVEVMLAFVTNVSREAEALDELVLVLSGGEQSDLLRRIGNARRSMTTLRSQLWGKKELLGILTTKQKVDLVDESLKVYLRDAMDDCIMAEQRLDQSKEMLNNLHSSYLARISLEMAEASNRVNTLMKRFSIMAAIFGPLAVIPGLFGMNVTIPGESAVDPSFAWFFGIVGAMLLLMAISLTILRCRRLL